MYELGAEKGKYYSVNVPLKDGIDDQSRSCDLTCVYLHGNNTLQIKSCDPINAPYHTSAYCIGYMHLFRPTIQAVMEHYRPTCIVLQVKPRPQATFQLRTHLLGSYMLRMCDTYEYKGVW